MPMSVVLLERGEVVVPLTWFGLEWARRWFGHPAAGSWRSPDGPTVARVPFRSGGHV